MSFSDQRRDSFACVMESIKQKYTMFSSEGVPLRATLTVTLREYRTLEDQHKQLGLSSPDRTHAHPTMQTDTLSGIARLYYDRPEDWRSIADKNLIDDPRRLQVGRILTIPRLS
jgi:nucleoid-associated protein YgaU